MRFIDLVQLVGYNLGRRKGRVMLTALGVVIGTAAVVVLGPSGSIDRAFTINLTAKASIQPVEIGGWKPVGIARDAVQALIDGLKVIGTILIWGIIFVLPIGLIIGIPIWLITRAVRKNKAKHPEKTDKIGPQGPLPDIK